MAADVLRVARQVKATMSGPQSSDANDLSVALLSPGWPAEAMPNGIVSYTGALVEGLVEQNVRCEVLVPGGAMDHAESFVHFFQSQDGSLCSKLMWRIDPQGWQRRTVCSALRRQIRALHSRRPLDIVEIEESFGWAGRLAGRIGVPLVVRLHGPWFLNGAANGAPPDKQFHRRDSWERAGLAAADAITAPSAHVLEQTRGHCGLEFPDARVIPNPVQTVPLANRWNLENCDQRRIAFIGRFDRHKGGDIMLDAFRLIHQQIPDAWLDFVGPDRGYIDDERRTWKIEQYLQ